MKQLNIKPPGGVTCTTIIAVWIISVIVSHGFVVPLAMF